MVTKSLRHPAPHHQRPIPAENLRRLLRIGCGTARGLVAQLRSDTQNTLDNRAPQPVIR